MDDIYKHSLYVGKPLKSLLESRTRIGKSTRVKSYNLKVQGYEDLVAIEPSRLRFLIDVGALIPLNFALKLNNRIVDKDYESYKLKFCDSVAYTVLTILQSELESETYFNVTINALDAFDEFIDVSYVYQLGTGKGKVSLRIIYHDNDWMNNKVQLYMSDEQGHITDYSLIEERLQESLDRSLGTDRIIGFVNRFIGSLQTYNSINIEPGYEMFREVCQFVAYKLGMDYSDSFIEYINREYRFRSFDCPVMILNQRYDVVITHSPDEAGSNEYFKINLKGILSGVELYLETAINCVQMLNAINVFVNRVKTRMNVNFYFLIEDFLQDCSEYLVCTKKSISSICRFALREAEECGIPKLELVKRVQLLSNSLLDSLQVELKIVLDASDKSSIMTVTDFAYMLVLLRTIISYNLLKYDSKELKELTNEIRDLYF